MRKESLRIIPLGGLGEIGKNITAIEYEDEIIVIDCGISFPDEDMYGVDLVIPDVAYLIENKDNWQVENGSIAFTSDSLIDEYNMLLAAINNENI